MTLFVILLSRMQIHQVCDSNTGDKGFDRFALDFLPPYNPEINPNERVWKLTQRSCLHNRYFPLLEDVIDAVETQFTAWTDRRE